MAKDKSDFVFINEFCRSTSRSDDRSGDETLQAKTPRGVGRVKEERKRRAMLFEPTRSILELSDPAIQSPSDFIALRTRPRTRRIGPEVVLAVRERQTVKLARKLVVRHH